METAFPPPVTCSLMLAEHKVCDLTDSPHLEPL